MRHALRDYFPAALAAFDGLTAADVLELLAAAPDPASAAAMGTETIMAVLKRAGRRNRDVKAEEISAALRAEYLGQPPEVTAAYAVAVKSHS
jgi:hypothetical protein